MVLKWQANQWCHGGRHYMPTVEISRDTELFKSEELSWDTELFKLIEVFLGWSWSSKLLSGYNRGTPQSLLRSTGTQCSLRQKSCTQEMVLNNCRSLEGFWDAELFESLHLYLKQQATWSELWRKDSPWSLLRSSGTQSSSCLYG